MRRIIWFEHMYQPSWNFTKREGWDPKRMIDECYRPNALLMKRLGLKINMNITQTMFDFFKQNDAMDVLEIYKSLGAQIEYVGSTAHHILAIQRFKKVLPQEIRQQHAFIEHYFNQSPKVFFPPEMAIDQETEHLLKSLDYQGMIMSGGTPNFAGWETTGTFKGASGLMLFAHNGILSGQFAFPVNGFHSDHDLQLVLDKIESYQLPVMFAFDHESFGGYHNPHQLEMKRRFFEIAKEKGWEFVHFSDLLNEPVYGSLPTLQPTTWVGDFSKWDRMPDRNAAINAAMESMTPENELFVRKWILPSCHLHVDYATELFWDFVKAAA
ncbi:hypothetical protein HY493_04505 [Candidatus Woesearchaeota archaeon]|nr:hypothetical protein [Candidatus Woesearchaeota archaeon]